MGEVCLATTLGLASVFASSCAGPATDEVAAPEPTALELALLARDVAWGGWHHVPNDAAVAPVLGRVVLAWEADRPEDALGILNEALEAAPGQPTLLEARAALYTAMGYPRAGRGDLADVVAADPRRASAWTGLAWINVELALPHRALDCAAEASRLGATGVELDLAAARAFARTGSTRHAAMRFGVALAAMDDPPRELLLEAARLAHTPDPIDVVALRRAALLLGDRARDPEVDALVEFGVGRTPEQGRPEDALAHDALRCWTRLVLTAATLEPTVAAVDPARLRAEPKRRRAR